MNLVDIFFLLIILVCGLIGLKRGFFKELVLTVGYIILLIISNKFTYISNNSFLSSIYNIKYNIPINSIFNKCT